MMNQTRSNLIIISLFAISTIVCLKHNSNADTTIPLKLVAHEFDLADANGKIIGTMRVTKTGDPKFEVKDDYSGRTGSISMEIFRGAPIIKCTSAISTNINSIAIGTNGKKSAIIFTKLDPESHTLTISTIGPDSKKNDIVNIKLDKSSVIKSINSANKPITIGSSDLTSSIQADCPKGYHYECLICPNGRFVGYVKDGFHEQDGPNGTYPAPDPKLSK